MHLEVAAQALHVEVEDAQRGDGARVAAQDAAQLDRGVIEGALGAAGRPLYGLVRRLCALTCTNSEQSVMPAEQERQSLRIRPPSLHAPVNSMIASALTCTCTVVAHVTDRMVWTQCREDFRAIIQWGTHEI